MHIVFPKMVITTTSTKIIPSETYIKNAGKIFSNSSIIKRRIVIMDIPIPIVRHSFFSLYFAFSSFEAILYPAISQPPCPEIKTMEIIANIITKIHTSQSGPVDKSATLAERINISQLLVDAFPHLNGGFATDNIVTITPNERSADK